MSTLNPAENIPNHPILSAQRAITLVSQSWNLVRANLKDSIFTLFWPLLLFGAGTLLLSIPASLMFLTTSKTSILLITIFCVLAGIAVCLVGLVGWMLSWCVLIRLYYSAIVNEKPLSLKACWHHVLTNWQPLGLTVFVVMAFFTILLITNLLIFFVGIIVSGAAFSALAIIQHNGLLKAAMSIVFLLVWGFLVLGLLISMITLQSMISSFPFLAIATHPDPHPPWWPTIRQSFRLVLSNFPRLILFGVLFFLFAFVISMVLHAPIFIWTVVELMRLGVSHQQALPFHLQVGMNLWNMLTQFIMTPLYTGALVLIWYDCQVRKEGLDLELWLQRIIQRRNNTPQTFLPDSQ